MLKPSYWTFGVCNSSNIDQSLRERDWQEIVESGEIRAMGKNLDWLQKLSPLKDCVFLRYGDPYKLFELSAEPIVFDTAALIAKGGFIGRDFDGGLWAKNFSIGREICDSIAGDSGRDLFENLEERFERAAEFSPHIWLGHPEAERFVSEFQSKSVEFIKAEALRYGDAVSFLESLTEDDLEGAIVELYFPAPLSLPTSVREEWIQKIRSAPDA